MHQPLTPGTIPRHQYPRRTPDARRYLQMGVTFVAVGSDLGVLRAATQALRGNYLVQDAAPIP